MKSGIEITESAGHGKAVAGTKRTSTWQVREYNHTGSYMLRKQFRFTLGDWQSRQKAYAKAKTFAETL